MPVEYINASTMTSQCQIEWGISVESQQLQSEIPNLLMHPSIIPYTV